MFKVWGYVYGPRYEENIRRWIENTFKTKVLISSEKEVELR